MKYNFSNYTRKCLHRCLYHLVLITPAFWDWVCGTGWDTQDQKARDNYQKSRALAEYQVNKEGSAVDPAPIAISSALEKDDAIRK